jgi:hypothetical protein
VGSVLTGVLHSWQTKLIETRKDSWMVKKFYLNLIN